MNFNQHENLTDFDDTYYLQKTVEVISDENASLVLRILAYGVTPFISILGVTGNIFSIKILIRHGLHKCSNIILVALAFSDICYLIGFNNFPNNLYQLEWGNSYPFSHNVSRFLHIVYVIFILVDYGVGLASLTIPTLITVERFIAVFFPLKCSQIVTPRRVWIAIAFIYVYCMAFVLYSTFWFEFAYGYDSSRNMSVGTIERSALFYKDLPSIPVLEEIFFSIKIPPLFTVVGCLMIIVKLRFVSKKRMEMTSGSTQSKQATFTKTTQLLLVICFVYLCVCLILGMLSFLPKEWAAHGISSDHRTNMGRIMYQIVNICLCLNSSWNFTIYVVLNKKFRETFLEIMTNCCRSRSKNM